MDLASAKAVADRLRADAADRDRANRRPVEEVELLRGSGLLAVPPDDHVTTHAVTRIVSAADPSIGHLLGYHYLHLWRAGLFGDPETAAWMRRQTAEHRLFWAGVSSPPNPADAGLKMTTVDGGFLVNGRRTFATGAAVADRLVASARDDSGEIRTFLVDARAPGIGHPDDWDNIGQRLSASGSVVFDDVRIGANDILGSPPSGDVRISLTSLAFQAILAQTCVAIAEGALAEAADYTRQRARPWLLSGVAAATEDPYVLAGYGELVASVRAAGLLADHGTAALQDAADRGAALTAEQRGEAAATISAAKIVATKTVNETTARIFEFIGARATAGSFGFDRFWRNARTLTLHDPVTYKARELGAHYLTGEPPEPTAYS
ncbi:acyl-CoA dehydrogenase family protein [Saccharopolyspora sp. NPDC050389]|uniref:acyl-CoA dehydrogenase family protein n=1 Tax=Saccharopolyspora sp. NPDC050389 TaxID=3155516 RepID=UPI0033E8AF87